MNSIRIPNLAGTAVLLFCIAQSCAGQSATFRLNPMQNNGSTEGTGSPMAPTNNGITFSTLSNYVSTADSPLGTFGFNGTTNGVLTFKLNLTFYGSSPSLLLA
jgi:hypothetical protein